MRHVILPASTAIAFTAAFGLALLGPPSVGGLHAQETGGAAVTLPETGTTAGVSTLPPEAAGGMVLELNSAEDSASGGCQLTMVATNETGQALARAAWQVAVFDRDGVVRALPILDFGALTAGKTRVALFDLPGRSCPEIARIVVNDVADCRLADGADAPDLCLNRLSARTLGTIAFGL